MDALGDKSRPAVGSALSLAAPSSRFTTLGDMMARVEAVERRLSELDPADALYSPRSLARAATPPPNPFESRISIDGDGGAEQQPLLSLSPRSALVAQLTAGLEPARSAVTPPAVSTELVPATGSAPGRMSRPALPRPPSAKQLSEKATEALASRRSTPLLPTPQPEELQPARSPRASDAAPGTSPPSLLGTLFRRSSSNVALEAEVAQAPAGDTPWSTRPSSGAFPDSPV